MKKARIIALCFACLLLLNNAASALSLSDFERYSISVDDAASRLSLNVLSEEPRLYEEINCLAISAENDVAIWSGPAPDAGFEGAVAVYDSYGNYRYGFELHKESSRGMDSLFFVEDSLCLYFTIYDMMCVIDSNGRITDAFDIHENTLAGLSDGRYPPMSSYNDVRIDPNATCRLVEFREGRVVIADAQGKQTCLYDNSDMFRHNRMLSAVKTAAPPIALILFFTILFVHDRRRRKTQKKRRSSRKRG